MSEYIGTVGDKLTLTVKVINEYTYTDNRFSYYGTEMTIYTFADANGNVFVWKTSSCLCQKILVDGRDEGGREFVRKGDVIKLTGKVKEHSEYKETKQTVLERCKLVEIIEKSLTKEELDEIKAQEQRDSIRECDFIWRMPYKQYKEHYSDCETVAGSFHDGCDARGYKVKESTIEVIIRAGRLKASGVRGEHFSGYKMQNQDGEFVVYRAVCEENAMKRVRKDFPADEWKCVAIY
jgi:hypothetical protein